MRAKFINEKFKEKSDPIEDMGIGAMSKFIKQLKKDSISDDDIVSAYDETIDKFNHRYPQVDWQKVFDELPEDILNEKFQEKSDPIEDMGIGMNPLMKKYKDDKLVKHYQIFKNFKKEILEGYGLSLEKLFYLGENEGSFQNLTISQIIENSQLIYHKEIFNSEKAGKKYLDDTKKESIVLFIYNTKFGKIADASWKWTTRPWNWRESKNIYFGDVFVLDKLKEHLNEEFIEKSDPIKDMGIGVNTIVYDIESDGEEGYNFRINKERLLKIIREEFKYQITDNEISRFLAFDMEEIYQEIPMYYFEKNDLAGLDKYIIYKIKETAPYWLGMHGDEAMRIMHNRR